MYAPFEGAIAPATSVKSIVKTTFRPRFVAAAIAALLLAGCGAFETSDPQSTETPSSATTGPATDGTATLIRMGDFARERGEIGSAVSLYRQAHSADTQAIGPLLKLGSVLAEAGEFDQSAGAFRTAIELDRSSAEALRGLGNAKIGLGQPGSALLDLQSALTLEESASTLNSMGVAQDLLGRHGDAKASYQRAIDLSPGDLDLNSNLAVSNALSGNIEEAVSQMSLVATAPAATARHRGNLAMILVFAGRENEARDVLDGDLSAAETDEAIDRFTRWARIEDSGAKAAAINAGA